MAERSREIVEELARLVEEGKELARKHQTVVEQFEQLNRELEEIAHLKQN
jgi:hypothetical protein